MALRSWVTVVSLAFCLGLTTHGYAQGLLGVAASDSTKSPKDTIWRDPGREKPAASDSTEPVKYEMRQYDHRQQVIVGSVVMLCIALTLVGMNNYNPRR